MKNGRFESFEEFWPFYVKEHSKKATRTLHAVGTTAGILVAAYALWTKRPWLIALAPVLGYGGSWIGHFFVEKNTPATFTYPAWSFRGDFRMLSKIYAGTMDAEVERVLREEAEKNASASNGSSASEPLTVS